MDGNQPITKSDGREPFDLNWSIRIFLFFIDKWIDPFYCLMHEIQGRNNKMWDMTKPKWVTRPLLNQNMSSLVRKIGFGVGLWSLDREIGIRLIRWIQLNRIGNSDYFDRSMLCIKNIGKKIVNRVLLFQKKKTKQIYKKK